MELTPPLPSRILGGKYVFIHSVDLSVSTSTKKSIMVLIEGVGRDNSCAADAVDFRV